MGCGATARLWRQVSWCWARRVILSVDWTLLVFMAMFIDVHLLTQLPALQGMTHQIGILSAPGLWLTAIGLCSLSVMFPVRFC